MNEYLHDDVIPEITRISSKLVRMVSGSGHKGENCIVGLCYDKSEKGIYCNPIGSAAHFTCQDCFSENVINICHTDPHRLLKSNGRLQCSASPQCDAPSFTSSEVLSVLSDEAMEMYMNVLLDFLESRNQIGGPSPSHHELSVGEVIALLTLKCPNDACRAPLDPQPDGCLAMTCGACKINFCWLCFVVSATNQKCHEHVLLCGEHPRSDAVGNPVGDRSLFLPVQEVDPVHRRRKIEAIRRYLLEVSGENWEYVFFYCDVENVFLLFFFSSSSSSTNSTCQRCRAVVIAATAVLQDSQITVEDIFSGTNIRPEPERRVSKPSTNRSWLTFVFVCVIPIFTYNRCGLAGWYQIKSQV
jgi:hypothetical protein